MNRQNELFFVFVLRSHTHTHLPTDVNFYEQKKMNKNDKRLNTICVCGTKLRGLVSFFMGQGY